MTRIPTNLMAALSLTTVGRAAPPEIAEPPVATVRLNQLGFERTGPKLAIVAAADARPLAWSVRDRRGRIVASGRTEPFGADAASGERLHRVDLRALGGTSFPYVLRVGGEESRSFAISDQPYRPLAVAAMSFFYQQRSGVPIKAALVQRPDLARPAGHPAEVVECFTGVDKLGVRWPACPYRLDVTGGWYDAGDHGKYVVNGALSAWTLLDLADRLPRWGASGLFADGSLALPERGNGRDDLLDEVRVEVDFLLAMQVPHGARLRLATGLDRRGRALGFREMDAGGLAHHKVAFAAWTGLPSRPSDEAMPRHLFPPSTAATLNLAASAAQAARVWRERDPAFAARALQAATRAWAAAERHPALIAQNNFDGSGDYGDRELADERFWAAAELLTATGDERYRSVVASSPFLSRGSADLGWANTDLAGVATLATAPDRVPQPLRAAARRRILQLADDYAAERGRSGYHLPYAGTRYAWGSNSMLLNRALIAGVAWQVARRVRDREVAVDVLDYLLGRNPLDQSYVSGFGARPMRRPHHRFWAVAFDPAYPAPPPGALSGGPNNIAMADEVSAKWKGRCAPQRCWRDDAHAFAWNEVAINWNAPLVWTAAFLDATRDRSAPPRVEAR